MKNLYLSLLFVCSMVLGSMVYADVASLNNQKPVQGDFIQMFHNGAPYAVNWTDLVRYNVQATNWTAIGIIAAGNAGSVNWTLPNAYIGG